MTTAHSIAPYIKEIGRGKDGARSLTREQAVDLFGKVLDKSVSDLEIGAFCLAMRIKGETTEELMGFIDAAQERISSHALPDFDLQRPIVVIPSYNGARKLPLLTPLLAALLARQGLQVLIHGLDDGLQNRITCAAVMSHMAPLKNVAYSSIAKVSPSLQQLLDVRRVVGLRNSAHSVVKLINPYAGQTSVRSVLVTSYTHPEYAISMQATLMGMKSTALLLRGTEGEAVADPRRLPNMTGLQNGHAVILQAAKHGSIDTALEAASKLPTASDSATTAVFIQALLAGDLQIPSPIAQQVQHILSLL